MIRETLCRTEVVYSAGSSLADAEERMSEHGGFDQPQDAWDVLDYTTREYHSDRYEVYEFRTEKTVVKILPPYTAR